MLKLMQAHSRKSPSHFSPSTPPPSLPPKQPRVKKKSTFTSVDPAVDPALLCSFGVDILVNHYEQTAGAVPLSKNLLQTALPKSAIVGTGQQVASVDKQDAAAPPPPRVNHPIVHPSSDPHVSIEYVKVASSDSSATTEIVAKTSTFVHADQKTVLRGLLSDLKGGRAEEKSKAMGITSKSFERGYFVEDSEEICDFVNDGDLYKSDVAVQRLRKPSKASNKQTPFRYRNRYTVIEDLRLVNLYREGLGLRPLKVGGPEEAGNGSSIGLGFYDINGSDVPNNSNNNNNTAVEDSVVAGKESGFFFLSPRLSEQTELTHTVRLTLDNAGGTLTESVIQSHVLTSLSITRRVFERFYDGDRVDQDFAKRFSRAISSPDLAPRITTAEKECIGRNVGLFLEEGNGLDWKRRRRRGKRGEIKERYSATDKNGRTVVKGSEVFHAPIGEVGAWFYNQASNEHKQRHIKKNGNTVRSSTYDDNTRSLVASCVLKVPFMSKRRFDGVFVWDTPKGYIDDLEKKLGGREGLVISFEPPVKGNGTVNDNVVPEVVEEDEMLGDVDEEYEVVQEKSRKKRLSSRIVPSSLSDRTVLGEVRGMYLFQSLAPSVTSVTIYQTIDLKGSAPTEASNYAASYALNPLDSLAVKYSRPGRVVDAEVRDCFIASYCGLPSVLSTGQQELVDRCVNFRNTDGFEVLSSSSPFIKLYKKLSSEDEGQKVLGGLGKSVSTVNASAAEVMAWTWDWCSCEKMRIHFESRKSIARMTVKEVDPNEQVVSTVKQFPFPFRPREFLVRCVWKKEVGGTFVYCWEDSEGVSIDYGGLDWKRKYTRASSVGFMSIKPTGPRTCEVMFVQRVDAGGLIPQWVASLKIKDSLSLAFELEEEFKDRADGLDLEDREKLAMIMTTKEQTYRKEDIDLAERVKRKFGALRSQGPIPASRNRNVESGTLVSLVSPDPFVKMEVGFLRGDPHIVGRAVTVVDGDYASLAAYDYKADSRNRLSSFYNNDGGVKREVTKINDNAQTNCSVYDLKIRGLSHREFKGRMVWKKIPATEGGSGCKIRITSEPVGSSNDGEDDAVKRWWCFGKDKNKDNVVQANMWAMIEFEQLPAKGGFPQTKVTLISQLNLMRGFLPTKVVNDIIGKKLLSTLGNLRLMYDKSEEIDGSGRLDFVAKLERNGAGNYSPVEDGQVQKGVDMMQCLRNNTNMTTLSPPSPLATWKLLVNGDTASTKRSHFGLAQTVVRCSKLQCLGYHWNGEARNGVKVDTLEKEYLERDNAHCSTLYVRKRFPFGFPDHDYVGMSLFKELDDGRIMFVSPTATHPSKPVFKGVVRGSYECAIEMNPISESETLVTFVVELENGILPTFMKKVYMGYQLRRVTIMQQYFQKLRKLVELDAKDGVAMGHAFMLKIKAEKKRHKGVSAAEVRVAEVVSTHRAMKHLAKLHPFFSPFMVAVVRNKVWKSKDVKTKLFNLSIIEGQRIGGGLALALISNTAPESAVDEWVYRYPALIELEEMFAWFRPMLNVVGKKILATSNTGVKYRAFSSAALSIMDVFSDGVMIRQYILEGSYGFAKGIIATIVINTSVQLLIVFTQNRKMPTKILLWQLLTTIFCLKPAVDARKVASGVEKHVNELYNSEMEMTMSRSVEIVCESLPSGIMQMYAFLLAKDRNNVAAAVSIVISAMTTGFAGTIISWDLETSTIKREVSPDFYGYIKNDPTSRTFTFLAMFMLTCTHVLMKTMATSLLICVSETWLAIYLGGDMVVFLLVKIIRGDFRYWFNLPNSLGWFVSLLMRVAGKVLADFTLVLQQRHSYEVGGVQFCLLIVHNQVGCFVAGWVYLKYYDGGYEAAPGGDGDVGGNRKLGAETLWAGLLGLFGLFLVSGLAFVGLMDRKYLGTFITTMTAKQSTTVKFRSAKNNQQRINVLKNHPTYYKEVVVELQELIDDNWDDWMKDRPEWLTDNVVASVPDKFLPTPEVKRLEKEGGGKRRRSSAFGETGEGGRTNGEVLPDSNADDPKRHPKP